MEINDELFLDHSAREVFRFEPLDLLERCEIQPFKLALALPHDLLEAMSVRSFESSVSSKTSSVDCLKVRLWVVSR